MANDTLQEALSMCVRSYPIKVGEHVALVLENHQDSWVFQIKGNWSSMIRHVNKITDPISDICNTIEPEDFK